MGKEVMINAILTSKNYHEFMEKVNCDKNSYALNNLFNLISRVLSKEIKDKTMVEVVYKAISFIEKISIDDKNINNTKIIERITNIKDTLITNVKSVEKDKRKNNEKIDFLRNVINRLEKLELAFLYNIVSPKALTNYDIVSKILFDEKVLLHSKYLIEHYPYIINVYNITGKELGKNIVDELTDKYLEALDNYVNNHKQKLDLFYYDNLLEELFKNDKIKISNDTITNNLNKIKNCKTNNSRMYLLWLKNLTNILTKSNERLSNIDIDYMYNIEQRLIRPREDIYYEFQNEKLNNYVISIDGSDTIDRDDALSIKKLDDGNYLLQIIIADPTHYFKENSFIMNNAMRQGESIYYKDEVLHMLPEQIITNYLSLDENKIRPVRSYNYLFDKYGNVIDFNITKNSVIVNKNLTYTKANNIITNNTNNKKLEEAFENLIYLKDEIVKKYGDIKDDSYKTSTKAEELIAKYMIFNNYYVANYFNKNNYPFVYRAHILHKDFDHLYEKISNLKGHDHVFLENMINSLSNISMSSFFSTTITKHDGLNLERYGFTTSPIRRYADILVNRCEDNFYFNKLSDQEAYRFIENLESNVKTLNDRHIEIMEHFKKRERS